MATKKPVKQLTPTERVDNGKAWFDGHVPGWYWLINPKTVDVRSGRLCPLGQAFEPIADAVNQQIDDELDHINGYRWAIEEFGVQMDAQWDLTHGFMARNLSARDAEELNRAWTKAIQARRRKSLLK